MNIWGLITHLGVIYQAISTIESIVAACVKEKRLPNASDDAALLAAAEALLSAGLIQIPGLDMNQIVASLDDLKKQLVA